MSEKEITVKILAIDPGVETGYAYGSIENEQLRFCPLQSVDEVDDIWRRLQAFQPGYIVVEDFQFRKRSRAGLELFPVQVIGVVRLWSLIAPYQCVAYKQSPARGKEYYTNPILQQLGLYKRGLPHGMDATRHLLQFCMFGGGNRFIGTKRTEEFATIVDLPKVWKEAVTSG